MARKKRDTKAILKTIAQSERRSSVFWWMVEQHDEIIENSKREPIDWRSVCADLAKRGFVDTRGKPATEANARKTWQRVRKHVAAARESQAAEPQRPVHPSRVDKAWRPANAPPPPAEATPLLPPVGPQNESVSIRKKSSHDKKPYDPEAALARLDRIINERSGR